MAGFRTHIATSTTLGVAYAAGAGYFYGVPIPTCLLAGGLCSVSGMLPDIDSDTGVPFRESMAFAAAVIPMLMVDRFVQLGWPMESIAMAGGLIYVAIRFGVATLLRKYTVHRGMFHSIPAAIIAIEIAFLVCSSNTLAMRLYKAGAVGLGFMSHLVLDEMYSMHYVRGRLTFKSSFGTAIKFWSGSLWANISTYVKVLILTYIVLRDPIWAPERNRFDIPIVRDIFQLAERLPRPSLPSLPSFTPNVSPTVPTPTVPTPTVPTPTVPTPTVPTPTAPTPIAPLPAAPQHELADRPPPAAAPSFRPNVSSPAPSNDAPRNQRYFRY